MQNNIADFGIYLAQNISKGEQGPCSDAGIAGVIIRDCFGNFVHDYYKLNYLFPGLTLE